MLPAVYQKIVSCIGRSDDDPLVQQWLMNELGAERRRLDEVKFTDYGIADLGISLHCHGHSIDTAFFHIRTAAVREGSFKAHPYPLIAEITADDNQQTIMQKLNAKPLRQSVRYDARPGCVECFDEYEIGNYSLLFGFACEGALISSLSVTLRPTK